ncbi:hypothetical protein CFC21_040593 [Triticum aestivum]|uniref:Uncharacterized protein n=2 Tax=Triticum aestivum TaxID=4565 RepID=A0A9R1FHU5_WHEAT|nr:uncharacterized protein LOC123065157 [Triticum aestivum]KAF7028725.1 hypothetical protein CFC21_040593 [Triticum aestivum]CDM82638.1 unnamed protein product [Triticum aestivum]
MHGKPLRRIGEDCPDGATHKSVRQDICILLDRIHGFYESALDRLPAERIPSLTTRLLKAGVCFGFLDPVSNIIANTVSYTPSPEDEIKEEDEIISKVRTNTKDERIFDIPLYPETVDSMTVARRSLEGLVSFLCFQYRYLEKTEALRYLRLAGCDLLGAVALIEQDRNRSPGEPVFNIMSPTTKIALECAALSARHPEPAVLVGVSLSLMSRTVKVSKILGALCCLPSAAVKRLARLLRASIDLGADRKRKRKRGELTPRNAESVEWKPGMHGTFRHTQTLKLLLLGKIHGFYLEALALLPRDGLRQLHHCSLIKGGYCYGPMDPVSNIILNTIWYGTAFPMHQDFEFDFQVDMICTRTLMRIECCSLYGIVAFLRARFSSLSEHGALWHLLLANVDLRLAVEMVQQSGFLIGGTDLDAYKKAAVDSWHSDPDALVKFTTLSLDIEPTKLSHMLAHALDDCTVEHLTKLVSKSSPTKSKKRARLLNKVSSCSEILNKNQKMLIPAIRKKFKADQEFYVRKVNAALNKFSQQTGVDYELHIICGVNPKVCEGSTTYLYKKRFKYEYFHINFLATPKGSDPATTPRELFFAECSNGDNDEEERPSLCLPVLGSSIDHTRCFFCEHSGINIVHPYFGTYNGRRDDFQEMASGRQDVLIQTIISRYEFQVDGMFTLKEDWIYFDPNMDAKIAQMNPIPDWARKVREWGRIF